MTEDKDLIAAQKGLESENEDLILTSTSGSAAILHPTVIKTYQHLGGLQERKFNSLHLRHPKHTQRILKNPNFSWWSYVWVDNEAKENYYTADVNADKKLKSKSAKNHKRK